MRKWISLVVVVILVVVLASCQSTPTYPVADKLCALTFDDGPDASLTPLVLDKLEKYGVVATFFMIGQNINEGTKDVIDRVVSLNCEIGNHSWGWDSMNEKTPAEIIDSIKKTSDAIKKYSGSAPSFFRPPNLAVGDVMYQNIKLPFAEGVLGFDWAGTGTDAKKRAANVIKEMKDGAIILLHDVQPPPHPTPEALDILIPKLKKMGYEFVTLSELFKRKGIDPNTALKENRMWRIVE